MRVVGLVLAAALLLPVACAMAAEDASEAVEKATPLRPEFRHLRENLDFPPVERVTDAFPLSDQTNKAGWEPFAPMTDEFEGEKLDASKWWDRNPDWLGRAPALFYPGNVAVKDGQLHLTMKREEAPEMPEGYHTYTSAAVKSKTTTLYGYYEIKARAMKSAGSSAFWFYNSEPERWTEIDVFEIGCSPNFDKRVFMTVHVFHTPEEKEHWSRGGDLIAPKSLSDDYHVYGLEWDKDVLRYYFDGVLVREGNNTHWHQPLYLNFDSETFPDWFGMPEDKDLPSTFSIEYVRAWKRAQDAQPAAVERQGEAAVAPPSAGQKGDSPEIGALRQAYLGLKEKADNEDPRLRDESVRFDEQLRTALAGFVKALGSFDEARARLAPVVDFAEFPSKCGAGLFEAHPVEGRYEDTRPVIHYTYEQGKGGVDLAVCQSELLLAGDHKLFRCGFAPYALVIKADSVSTGLLVSPEIARNTILPVPYENMSMPIDTFDAGGQVPAILCVCGPAGKGGYLDMWLARYSGGNGTWMLKGFDGYERISRWDYDSESKTLSLSEWTLEDSAVEETWNIDVGKEMSKYLEKYK